MRSYETFVTYKDRFKNMYESFVVTGNKPLGEEITTMDLGYPFLLLKVHSQPLHRIRMYS